MAASLAEEQGRKQTAAPLPEQPEAELRRRFARSLLLPKVRVLLRLAIHAALRPCRDLAVTHSLILHEARPG